MNPTEIAQVVSLCRARAGLRVAPDKTYLMESRLAPVARREGYESISDLFEEGLDSLISAALTLVLVGTGMLLLDWPLALVVLAGFIPLTWLSAWYRRESATAYRRIRETNALVIVHFVETFGGLRAVQAFRREKRNE